jgi:hypothetical protein
MIAVIAPKRVAPQCASVRRQSSEAMLQVCAEVHRFPFEPLLSCLLRCSTEIQARNALTVPAVIFPEATGFLPFQRRRQFFSQQRNTDFWVVAARRQSAPSDQRQGLAFAAMEA